MSTVPDVIERTQRLVAPAIRAEIDRLADERMRHIAGYQMGWFAADGTASVAGGKAIRPAFTLLAAQTVGGDARVGVPAAAAIELVHNFSLLHDDVMDRDVERRHRPTAWVVFGEGQAILAGNAMCTAAIDIVVRDEVAGARCLTQLLASIQELISGQSQDLDLERRDGVTLDEVIRMEAGKTASLLACATAIGALAAGAPDESVDALRRFGHDVGIAFQLVDDILGIVGDPARTGKSSSSDVRAGKRSAPIVAALTAGGSASKQLSALLSAGPPATEEDVALATKLVIDAGGLDWAANEADRRLAAALQCLAEVGQSSSPATDGPAISRGDAAASLAALASYVVNRDR